MKIINSIQNTFIIDGILLLILIPLVSFFVDLDMAIISFLFFLSFASAFFVMTIRPMADIFVGIPVLRQMVILRKGLGIFSASVIVGFMLEKIVAPGSTYLSSVFSENYYSFDNYAIFAHLGDLSGFILLATSNIFSQRVLKSNWKRVQKLAYIYFYAGGIYEAFFVGSLFAQYALVIVTFLTLFAWALKIFRKRNIIAAQ